MIPEHIHHYIGEVMPALDGWCPPEKATRIVELMMATRPKLAVELGIFGGRALFAMALAMRETRSGVAWGIDSWKMEDCLEGEKELANIDWWKNKVNMEEVYRKFLGNVLQLGLTNECRFIREKGEVAVKLFEDQSIDFFHLDGNHSELCSMLDVRLWSPKWSPKCTLIVDDIDWKSQAKALQMIDKLGYRPFVNTGKWAIFNRK